MNVDDVLPLQKPSGFKRDISVDSCRLDSDHIQIRGQLTDTRTDFENPEKLIVVHCLVVRLVLRVSDSIITDAEFGLPKMAFENICEKLPNGAELLVGVDVTKGLSFRLKELYAGKRSCFHLSSLLQALVPTLTQCRSWNADFRDMDESLPAALVPKAMDVMLQNVKNSCHAWEAQQGGITQDFQEGRYGRMLDRMAPRLFGRWKQD